MHEESAAKASLFTLVSRGPRAEVLRNEHARTYQRKRVEIEDTGSDDLPAAAFSGHERVELVDTLNTLPKQLREPLLLQILGGFSGREIAQTLGISEQNVMTRLTPARQALQRMARAPSEYRNTGRR